MAQVLVLDRATLAVISNTSYAASDAGMAGLAAKVNAQGNGSLVVIDTPQLHSVVLPDQVAANSLNTALTHIGVHLVGTWLRSMSAIGTPGGGPGDENLALASSVLMAMPTGGASGAVVTTMLSVVLTWRFMSVARMETR